MPDIDVFSEPPHWRELGEAEAELKRQDERWGQQDHPDASMELDGFPAILGPHRTLAVIRSQESLSRERGRLGWDLILLEEVYEALSEPDNDRRCEELIQVAAVALQWVQAIRRRDAKLLA
jgi:hypothetical protein